MKNVKEEIIEINGDRWEKAIDKAFNMKKKDIKIDGFRKGSVSKDIYIKKVGIETLFMDAFNALADEEYKRIVETNQEDLACRPSVSIEHVDAAGIKIKFTIVMHPEVKLGKYKKLGIKREKVTVTKEEVDHEISHIVEHMSEIVNKEKGKVEASNIAVIDFDGVVDGEKLEGGSGENYELEIGSNTFIPGFEDGLIGMSIGETKELKLKFPEDYHENLKNKDVIFTVTVKGIKERVKPKMDKDFFLDLDIEGVESEDALKDYIKKEITTHKEQEVNNKYTDDVLRKATDDMKIEINDEIISDEMDRMCDEFDHELSHQGASLGKYLDMIGSTIDAFRENIKNQAIARIKTRYLLKEVVKAEKISVDDAEIKEKIKEEALKVGMGEDEFTAAVGGTEAVKYQLELNKALDVICS